LRRALDLVRPVRADAGDVVLTEVAAEDVLDPIDVLEVQVDVRCLDAIHVDEPLEHQLVLDRIDVRDAREVADQAARGGPASGADEHLLAGRVADVADDEEVVRQALLFDDAQLIPQPVDVALVALKATTLQALPGGQQELPNVSS
jgi:hypothetical protein